MSAKVALLLRQRSGRNRMAFFHTFVRERSSHGARWQLWEAE